MITSSRLLLILLLTVCLFPQSSTLHAQQPEPTERVLYYLAPDAAGIMQVFQHLLNVDEVNQITHADQNISHFGVAYDGLSVAYLSEGRLWLREIHEEAAEVLAHVDATEHLGHPVYSPDGQYIAYTNDGVWLLDLATRETRQLLVNVPLDLPEKHVSTIRLFTPQQFVMDAEGNASKLVVKIDIWEWTTVGIYDLTTGTLQEFETERDVKVNTDLLVLTDGRELLYGNNALAGEPVLQIAESLDAINTYTEVFDFSTLADKALFAYKAVEINLGIVRVLGTCFTVDDGKVTDEQIFTFDYNLMTDTSGDLTFVTLTDNMNEPTVYGPISADGVLMPVLLNLEFDDEGTPSGDVHLLNLETGILEAEPFTEAASQLQWQPSS